MKWLVLFSGLILFSCSDSGKEQPASESKNLESTDSTELNIPEVEMDPVIALRLEEQKNDIDSIQHVVEQWNKAINEKDYAFLQTLYAPHPKFYLKEFTPSGIVSSKRTWLEKHPEYRQEILGLQVQYPTNDEGTIRCAFRKVLHTKEATDSVWALLDLHYANGQYLIHKESDQASELVLHRTPTQKGIPATATYMYDYWLDTRNDQALAHSFVPYYMVLSYDQTDTSFYWYSGSLRSVTDFYLRNFNVENGFLSFEAAPIWPGREDDIPEEEDFMYFRFSILKDELAFIEHRNGWFDDLLGARLWRKIDEK